MKHLALLFTLYLTGVVVAQETESKFEKWSIRADYFRPKGLTSFTNATVNGYHFPKNVGFRIGAERNWRTKEKGRLYQTLNYSFYNDVYFERVHGLETAVGWQRNIFKGLFISAEVGLGYNFARSSHLISTFEGDRWVQSIDKSIIHHRFQLGLSGYMGYDFKKHFEGKIPLTLFIGYGANGITNFDKLNQIKAYAYHQPYFGIKWKF